MSASYENRQMHRQGAAIEEAVVQAGRLEVELEIARGVLRDALGQAVRDHGWPVELAAGEAGVSPETAHAWLRFYYEDLRRAKTNGPLGGGEP